MTIEVTQDTVLKFRNAMVNELTEQQYVSMLRGTRIDAPISDVENSHVVVIGYLYQGHIRVDKPSDSLGEGFRLHEFTVSETATRLGIDNTPPEWAVNNLRDLTTNILIPVRRWARSQNPNAIVRVTSGYRNSQLNRAVGGSTKSHHLFGRAADIVIPGLPPIEIWKFVLREKIPFAEMILYPNFIHLAYHEGNNNRRHFVDS